jgi:ribosomal-protein-alanine N-acetyltransferase
LIEYPNPPLAGQNVALRAWERDDLLLVREASADPKLLVGTTLPDPFTDKDGLAFIERQWSRAEREEGLSLVIEDTGRSVGAASLMLRRVGVADLGHWLLRDARGRGIGRQTVGLLVPWALQAMNLEAFEPFVHLENKPSRRILAGCGFSAIGSRRHSVGRIDEELIVYRRDR